MIEELLELHRITELKDGAVFRTEYVKDVWVNPIQPYGDWTAKDHMLVRKSTSYTSRTIRAQPKEKT